MNVALDAAGVLATVLLISTSKAFVPREKIATGTAPPRNGSTTGAGALRAIATLELLAAVGLILPAALDIAPVLVPLAATGAALLFIGAVTMRLRRGERRTIVPDLVYLALAVFVAWGRLGPEFLHRLTDEHSSPVPATGPHQLRGACSGAAFASGSSANPTSLSWLLRSIRQTPTIAVFGIGAVRSIAPSAIPVNIACLSIQHHRLALVGLAPVPRLHFGERRE